jgi:2'-5' RNA ligase
VRLFIGVEPSDPVRTAVARTSERLQHTLARKAPGLAARWVTAGNIHITLWFIGETSDAEGESLGAVLTRRPLRTAPFDLAPGGCGAFPPSGLPRVFWIGLTAGAEGMSALYREIGERLKPLGIEPEHRAYSAHATIARVKEAPRGSGRAIREILAATPADCGSMRVSHVTLFRSRLSPRGAAYEPVLRVPLS